MIYGGNLFICSKRVSKDWVHTLIHEHWNTVDNPVNSPVSALRTLMWHNSDLSFRSDLSDFKYLLSQWLLHTQDARTSPETGPSCRQTAVQRSSDPQYEFPENPHDNGMADVQVWRSTCGFLNLEETGSCDQYESYLSRNITEVTKNVTKNVQRMLEECETEGRKILGRRLQV